MAQRSENPEVAVLQDWRDGVDKTLSRIETKIDNLDKKFAAKWVQTAVSWVIGLIVGTVLTALLALVVVPHFETKTPTTVTSQTTSQPAATPSATASANSHSDTATPSDSQTAQSGGVSVTVPKVSNSTP